MPYLHLIGHLRLNKIHVLSGGGVSSIADGRVSLLFLHSLWKGGMDSVLRCMVEEWGRWMRSCWKCIQLWVTQTSVYV